LAENDARIRLQNQVCFAGKRAAPLRACRCGFRCPEKSVLGDLLAAFASKILQLRRSGARIKGMPPEVLSHLDSAAAILANEQKVAQAGLHLITAAAVA